MEAKKEKGKTIRVAAYCRVSTLLDDQDLSYETQEKYYKDLISKDNSMELVGIYGDHGISGLSAADRPEFLRLIADCDAGLIDLVLVKSISRFSRNTVECAEYLERLKQNGVEVRFEKEGLSSLDPRTEMVLSIYSAMAQNESASISDNIRWAHKKQAEAGNPIRSAPFGYRIVKAQGSRRWVINEEEAVQIRSLFRMAHAGCTFQEMMASHPDWSLTRLKGALKNEAYRGDILTNKTVKLDLLSKKTMRNTGQQEQFYVEQHHEPIVAPEVFDEVQEYLAKGYLSTRHKKRRSEWLKAHPEIRRRRNKLLKEDNHAAV